MQMRAALGDFNPAMPTVPGDEKSRLLPLVFEALVGIDESGTVVPRLAVEWRIGQGGQRLSFRLRANVKFHDGSVMYEAAVLESLRTLDARYGVTARGGEVIIDAKDGSAGKLLRQLANPRWAIVTGTGDGIPAGTGPFSLAGWEPGRRLVLRAFEHYWGGRPFVDELEIRMGRSERDQMVDLQLKRADLIEIPLTDARRAGSGIRLPVSEPVDLIAIVFRGRRANDEVLIRAINFSVDRTSIHQILAQRQGSPTGALLPQWLTGYAFLFPGNRDVPLARRLLVTVPRRPGGLRLGYPSSDGFLKSVAERLTLDLREAALEARTVAMPAPAGSSAPDGVLTRIRLTPDAAGSLEVISTQLDQLAKLPDDRAASAGPAGQFEVEAGILASWRVVPLLHLPVTFGLSERVGYTRLPDVFRFGQWRFEDIWIQPATATGGAP